MTYPISLLLLLLSFQVGISQKPLSLSGLTSVTITLKDPEDLLSHPGVFNHFEVIDERTDTARIGIHTFVPTVGHPHNRQLVFKQTAADEIAGYLNTHFCRSETPWSALIILRNLWLSDANFLREDRVKDPNIASERTHIRLKAEIYAFRDGFYVPILRFDTVQSYKRNNPYNNLTTYYALWNNDLSGILSEMTDSAAGLTLLRADHGRHLHLQDIQQYNRSRFDIPIASARPLKKGVYASFQEFKDNSPSILNYEIRQEKNDHLLYIKDGTGTSQYSHDAWGYCDGQSMFIMRDGKLYQLWKEGKAFYFQAASYKERPGWYLSDDRNSNYLVPDLVTGTTDDPPPPETAAPERKYLYQNKNQHMVESIYKVDMDSGAVY